MNIDSIILYIFIIQIGLKLCGFGINRYLEGLKRKNIILCITAVLKSSSDIKLRIIKYDLG